jgi:hypothetical protein
LGGCGAFFAVHGRERLICRQHKVTHPIDLKEKLFEILRISPRGRAQNGAWSESTIFSVSYGVCDRRLHCRMHLRGKVYLCFSLSLLLLQRQQ